MPDNPLADSPAYAREDMGVFVCGQVGSTLHGWNDTSGEWCESTDHGATWVDQGRRPMDDFGVNYCHDLIEAAGYRYAVGSGGKLWRTTAGSYTGWTDVTPAVPDDTVGRPSIIAHNGTVLLYGNYGFYNDYFSANGSWPGAYLWRSTDDGDTWTTVISKPDLRHIHAVRFDPDDSTKVFATMGDGPPDRGLHYSADSGQTWVQSGSTYYGIDLAFPDAVAGIPGRVYSDGDGPNLPHMLAYFRDKLTTEGHEAHPHIWYDQNPYNTGGSWMASTRGSFITSEGNLFYITTSEASASYGGRYGIWLAEGPLHVAPVLLEEYDGIWDWPNIRYGKTFESGGYLLNTRYRMVRPKFAGQ